MKKILLPIALLCLCVKLEAQVLVNPADTVPAIITPATTESGAIKFNSVLRPLRPIAGAPAPFFTYFWEFGDGTFSFEKDPLHAYADSGKFDVRLFATNNYDDGKRPPTRLKPVIVKKSKVMLAANTIPGFFNDDASIALKNNCMPKPGDDMMLILGYRNKGISALQKKVSGTVALLYNDKEFSSNNFDLAEARTYHGEKPADLKTLNAFASAATTRDQGNIYYASAGGVLTTPQIEQMLADAAAPVKEQMQSFKSSKAWHFENLKSGEEHFMFLNLKTTPEMIKDTNAVVRISGVYLPDDPLMEKEIFTIELQIVASHDPNKMSIRKTRMNYRLTGKHREISYRIRFQNTGKGPAKKVDVGVSLSPVFDPATITVSKTKPEVQACNGTYANQSCLNTVTGKDSVHFIFSNIYLPGTQQEGVHDADSTMGFVEYKIKFREKPAKLPIYTSAAIVFDKNEPIYTNRATGKFKMGLSPALIIGYGFPVSTNKSGFLHQKNFTIGASLSPYSSYKKYWQVELYFSDFKEASQTTSTTATKDTSIGKLTYRITSRNYTTSSKVTTLNLVPASLRYSFNKYVGGGLGALVSVDLNNTNKTNLDYALTGVNGVSDTNLQVLADKTSKAFSDLRASFFADITLGMVRVGPSIGLRYFYDPKSNISRMTTYATWKF